MRIPQLGGIGRGLCQHILFPRERSCVFCSFILLSLYSHRSYSWLCASTVGERDTQSCRRASPPRRTSSGKRPLACKRAGELSLWRRSLVSRGTSEVCPESEARDSGATVRSQSLMAPARGPLCNQRYRPSLTSSAISRTTRTSCASRGCGGCWRRSANALTTPCSGSSFAGRR